MIAQTGEGTLLVARQTRGSHAGPPGLQRTSLPHLTSTGQPLPGPADTAHCRPTPFPGTLRAAAGLQSGRRGCCLLPEASLGTLWLVIAAALVELPGSVQSAGYDALTLLTQESAPQHAGSQPASGRIARAPASGGNCIFFLLPTSTQAVSCLPPGLTGTSHPTSRNLSCPQQSACRLAERAQRLLQLDRQGLSAELHDPHSSAPFVLITGRPVFYAARWGYLADLVTRDQWALESTNR